MKSNTTKKLSKWSKEWRRTEEGKKWFREYQRQLRKKNYDKYREAQKRYIQKHYKVIMEKRREKRRQMDIEGVIMFWEAHNERINKIYANSN